MKKPKLGKTKSDHVAFRVTLNDIGTGRKYRCIHCKLHKENFLFGLYSTGENIGDLHRTKSKGIINFRPVRGQRCSTVCSSLLNTFPLTCNAYLCTNNPNVGEIREWTRRKSPYFRRLASNLGIRPTLSGKPSLAYVNWAIILLAKIYSFSLINICNN